MGDMGEPWGIPVSIFVLGWIWPSNANWIYLSVRKELTHLVKALGIFISLRILISLSPWRDRDLYSRVVYQWRTEGVRPDVCDEKGLNLDIQRGLSNSFFIFHLLPPTRFYPYCTLHTACRSLLLFPLSKKPACFPYFPSISR